MMRNNAWVKGADAGMGLTRESKANYSNIWPDDFNF